MLWMGYIFIKLFFPKNNNNIMVEHVNGRDDVRVEIFTNNWKQSNRVT